MRSVVIRWVLPFLIVAVALLCAGGLVFSKPSRVRGAPKPTALTMVTVVPVERGPVELSLTTVGEVSAAQDVAIQTEVSGTLSWVLPDLHAGMQVAEGQVVARLDPTAFDADVASARSTLASAQEALALELGSADVAALEARLVGPIEGANEAMVRREPQRASAEASVASAEAALSRAKRQRRLTEIRAPFDAILAEESLDVGRLVNTSASLGRWVGTARAEVTVPVPALALPWFESGDVVAELVPQGAPADRIRRAESVGATGVVDPTTRTARVLIRVESPYDTTDGPALLPGSFVEATLRGAPVEDASRIPRDSLVDGGAVWSVGPDKTLQKVPVRVLWRSGEEVIIAGVEGLDSVVARPSGTLLQGQSVRLDDVEEG